MEQNPKQLAVERIKAATNILVTVSKNPTVDQLAACIGLTLLLNKLEKHATAVFSGSIPSTIEFLQPEKTLETTTDSLRDFIIALDKSKADKLRYKVEDEVVRIFITPYRTSISEKDLEFSQGDFNVDVVVALGVTNKEDIDQAIVAHGRILHDAVVISMTNGAAGSDIGNINWHDDTASSLSEMLVSISESFQSGLLDAQMATAFLTGIVAETVRFSNEKTTPKVMTMSAQLMAAGANQQLIASQLTPPEPEPEPEPESQPEIPVADAPVEPEVVDLPVEPYQPPLGNEQPQQAESAKVTSVDGEIAIAHDENLENEIHIDDQGNLKKQQELLEAEEAKRKKEAEEAAAAEAAAQQVIEEPVEPTSEQENQDQVDDATSDSYLAGSSHHVVQPLEPTTPVPTLPPFDQIDDGVTSEQPPVQESFLPPVASAPAVPEPVEPPVEQASPAAVQDDSLTSLEKAVASPHLQATQQTVDEADPLEEARQAVNTASLDSEPRPQATQAVGAQIVDLTPEKPPVSDMTGVGDVLQQTQTQPIDPMAPPPVPPPMMPQYLNSQPNDQSSPLL